MATAGRREDAAKAYDAASRLAKSPRVLADWLRAAATSDEAGSRMDAALWNLDRAIALTPDDASLQFLAYNLAAGVSDWKRAARVLNDLATNPALPTPVRYFQAVACLKIGDAAGYRSACAGMAKRLPKPGPMLSPIEANNAAMAFAVGPNATDDWTKPLAWIDFALANLGDFEKTNPEAKTQLRQVWHQFLSTRGAVLFRAGRFEDAAKVLREAMSNHPVGGEFDDWVFLALAEHKLGHTDAAKAAAAKARGMKEPGTVWDRAEMELLTVELNTAIPTPTK